MNEEETYEPGTDLLVVSCDESLRASSFAAYVWQEISEKWLAATEASLNLSCHPRHPRHVHV